MAASTTVNHANGAAKETAPEEPRRSDAAPREPGAVERIEQREWQESLDYVLHDGGPEVVQSKIHRRLPALRSPCGLRNAWVGS